MVLVDLEGIWRLPIIIGGTEAQAIAIAMSKAGMSKPRKNAAKKMPKK
jgi:bifunctional DNase/RNase